MDYSTRLPCPSLYLRVCSYSCPLSQSYYTIISSSVSSFSSCLQFFPASWSFPSDALCIRWPKYWSFSFSIGLSNEYSGLISFGIGWFDLAVQGTAPQFKSINSLVFGPSWWSNCHIRTWLFVKPQLWLYRPLLTRWCLCFLNMLSRFVIAFLPRSKISWLQLLSILILEPQKIKCHCFQFSPFCLPWSDRTGCHNLSFLNVEF